jgi:Tol biopolymer transport system component
MRRVTDDAARDRAPVFLPDGRSLAFYSNRDGKWAPWIVGVDGGGLRKAGSPKAGAVYVCTSPKGDAITFISDSGRGVYMMPLGHSSPVETELPNTSVDGKFFNPSDWSPDGKQLTGTFNAESGRPAGVGTYDLAAKSATLLVADETYGSNWLPDSARIVYFTKTGRELVVLDTKTRKRSVVDVRLPGPSLNEVFAISPDGRTIYYGAVRAEADIWIVERK